MKEVGRVCGVIAVQKPAGVPCYCLKTLVLMDRYEEENKMNLPEIYFLMKSGK